MTKRIQILCIPITSEKVILPGIRTILTVSGKNEIKAIKRKAWAYPEPQSDTLTKDQPVGHDADAIEYVSFSSPFILLATPLKEEGSGFNDANPVYGNDRFYEYGCICRIIKATELQAGNLIVEVEGVERARIVELSLKSLMIPSSPRPIVCRLATATILEPTDLPISDPKAQAMIAPLRKSLPALTNLTNRKLTDPIHQFFIGSQSSQQKLSHFVDLIAFSFVNITRKEGLDVLSTVELKKRIEILDKIIDNQISYSKVSKQINSKARQKLYEEHRKTVVKDQADIIRKELNGGGDSELDTLEKRLKEVAIPDEQMKMVTQELSRLKQMSSSSNEYQSIRSYLQRVLEMPWGIHSVDTLDISHVQKVLEQDHHGLDKIKRRIIEALSVRRLKKDAKSPIICFVGPPGVGKTSLASSIAKAMNRKFQRISLGGVTDEAHIRGHRRTYVDSMPGRIIDAIIRAKVSNPLILLDEVDKIGRDGRGDLSSALLEVLDPEQNSTFTDHYIKLPFDLSQVMFIATANDIENISPAMCDRLEMINLSAYSPREKEAIAKKHLLPKQISENGLPGADSIVLSDGVVDKIVVQYTREPGVRSLERNIGAICRYYVVEYCKAIDSNPDFQFTPATITVDMLEDILGPAQYADRISGDGVGEVGLATGLACFSSGIGTMIYVEACSVPSTSDNRRIEFTGQLGDVLKESGQVARSWVLSHFASEPSLLQNKDIHVHLPDGAIPKDGPSAGVSLVASIVSLLLNKPVPSRIAMTGEITLRGAVGRVGGIKEKILAAYRSGIKTVLVPAENEREWLEMDKSGMASDFKVVGCARIEQVLENCGLDFFSETKAKL